MNSNVAILTVDGWQLIMSGDDIELGKENMRLCQSHHPDREYELRDYLAHIVAISPSARKVKKWHTGSGYSIWLKATC